jgi:Putative transposase/Transposase zinc-binding domain
MRAILGCRTAAMGSHTEPCANCGQPRIAYNSCRNRHCPKCQQHKQLLWTAQREAELLPIEYFHVVFTLPHQFNAWARRYPRTIYDLLFAAARQSLLAMGQRTLGGELGISAVLHTWGQTLQQHIHLHCIVTGGALSADGQRFQRSRPGFLGSVEALSASYQQRYLRGLQRWAEEADEADLRRALRALIQSVSTTAWVVYAKRPMCGPEQVIAYLGRYTQRVAIGNSRLLSLAAGRVRFRWKDYRAKGQAKAMELSCDEFTRRFLQHVLPTGYVRIRHYGLLASRGRAQRLARCRALLQASVEAPARVRASEPSQTDSRLCVVCQEARQRIAPAISYPLRE